jgi:hypothetical protein
MSSCFPHVVNLACKAVLEMITDMDYASEESDVAAVTYNIPTNTFCENIKKDPIAVICNVVQIVSTYFLLVLYLNGDRYMHLVFANELSTQFRKPSKGQHFS